MPRGDTDECLRPCRKGEPTFGHDSPLIREWEEGHADRHGKPDVLAFRECAGPPPPGHPPLPFLGSDFAICVSSSAGALNAEWFQAWTAWHSALGVTHLFWYASGPPLAPPAPPVGMSYDWISIHDWVDSLDTWSRAQLWSMHDCLFRGRAQGVRHLLFLDVDELLRLPPGQTLHTLISRLEEEGTVGASFGSIRYLPPVCPTTLGRKMGGEGDAPPLSPPVQRLAWRATEPECLPWPGHAPQNVSTCRGWQGRRKYVVRAREVERLQIHSPVLDPQRFSELSTEDGFFLKHVLGAAWGGGGCGGKGCALQPNGSLLCPVNATHCGSDCDPATRNPTVRLADTLWVEEGDGA